MKHKNIISTIICAVTLCALPCQAAEKADFYVAPNGSDKNPGTIKKPFQSFERARDAVRKILSKQEKDIIVMFRDGIYNVDKTVVLSKKDEPKPDHKVIYQNYPDEKPVFSLGKKITGWKKFKGELEGLSEAAKDKIWETSIPETKRKKASDKSWFFYALFDNDEFLPRARTEDYRPDENLTPEEIKHSQDPDNGNLYKFVIKNDYLKFKDKDIKNWDRLHDIEIFMAPKHPWLINYLPLKSVDVKNRVARTTIPGTYRLAKRSYSIENVFEGLDTPGEWVLDSPAGKLYLWPRSNKPSDNIIAPVLREFIRVEGEIDYKGPKDTPVRGFVFKGLTFKHGARDVWTKDDAGIQHDWDMFDKNNASIRFRGAEDCIVDGCTFAASANSAIRADLHCKRIIIKNNRIDNIGGTGVLLCGYGPGTKDVNQSNEIINNHMSRCGQLYWHAPGIFIWNSGKNIVRHNRVHDLAYDGIIISGVRARFYIPMGNLDFWNDYPEHRENMKTMRRHEIVTPPDNRDDCLRFSHAGDNIVEYNEFYDCMHLLGDGNCVYLSATGRGRPNIVRKNLMHSTPKANALLRPDDDQFDVVFSENILIGAPGQHVYLKLKCNNLFENNICFGWKREVISFSAGSPLMRNIFYNTFKKTDKFYNSKVERSSDYNIFYAVNDEGKAAFELVKKNYKSDKNSIYADPMFVDLKGLDFRLKPDSPARKLGIKEIEGLKKIGLIEEPAFERMRKEGFDIFTGK